MLATSADGHKAAPPRSSPGKRSAAARARSGAPHQFGEIPSNRARDKIGKVSSAELWAEKNWPFRRHPTNIPEFMSFGQRSRASIQPQMEQIGMVDELLHLEVSQASISIAGALKINITLMKKEIQDIHRNYTLVELSSKHGI
ncbi:hypothetical protein GWI33_018656 [Rhynchophorus ferrugineus]|uniref:Uncharacterized protein n=1 Tax=Rhynchophorus ferrugineus TaxID=354439 RepID=A0A834HUH3_RHYFE|nr:hypothetical protein GWI33_018656 [Rhynchophorus ferrugineus]